MIHKKNITGIILAGGKSKRMGKDKGFLIHQGKSFMQHSIEALQPLVSSTIIVANNVSYDVFNLKRVEDIIKDAGPLSGLYSGLHHSSTSHNLVLSCDVPLINTKTLEKLIDAEDSVTDIIQIESHGKSMPLIALYKKQCKNTFYKLLQKGERCLGFAVSLCKVKTIVLNPENEMFTLNINTPIEIKNLKNDSKN